MLKFGLGIYWKFTWCIFIPIALLVIFIYAMIVYTPLKTDDGEPYPASANGKFSSIVLTLFRNTYNVQSRTSKISKHTDADVCRE